MNDEVQFDLEPMFKSGEDVGCPFEVNLEIEQEAAESFNVTITGHVAIFGSERYVAFDVLADGTSSLGRIQREWARLNQLFIVDRKKVFDVIEAHSEVAEDKPVKESHNGKTKRGK